MFHHPKAVEDDEKIFPTVARIPDAMLRKVDQSHHVLVSYFKTINPDIETGVLLPQSIVPSKLKKGSKKDTTEIPSKPQPENVETVVRSVRKKKVHTDPPPIVVPKPVSKLESEVLPSKSGVLKKLKKKSSQTSPFS
ncbi:unnamed protein product [Lactuca saligna]|uniref:Uncharacterized protein n=1 Tax=Lactuca saligna TaxID=75948 RepID=A0AA35ZDB3_LACSI|nr:unnamed protein product [Lactuca saligna]